MIKMRTVIARNRPTIHICKNNHFSERKLVESSDDDDAGE